MQAKLAAVMIVGDPKTPNDQENWERVTKSLEPYFDGLFINYNGLRKKLPYEYKPEIDTIVWRKFAWKDDFALARNQSFSLVPGDKYDWRLWLDLDDTLEGGENLQELIAGLDSETQGVFLKYDYAVDPETGLVTAEQWRERLWRTDCNVRWEYPVHEVCHHPPGTQLARREGVWLRHWRISGSDDRATRTRNRRILSRAQQEHPDVPRYGYYLANEIYAEAATLAQRSTASVEGQLAPSDQDQAKITSLADAAIDLYKKFIPKAPSADDAYLAAHQIAECNRFAQRPEQALQAEMSCLKIHPSWPDAYVGLAQTYLTMGDWDKAIHWANSCLSCASKPDTTQVQEPTALTYMPYMLRGLAREQKGQWMEALEDYERAAKVELNDHLQSLIDGLLVKIETPKEEARPSLSELRKITFGATPDKSIAFVTRPLFEPWHPDLVKEGGIGGAETCVMEVAKRFAADGWRVAVFGTPGEHYGPDESGVEYWPVEEFLSSEHFHVVVASRSPEFFDANVSADMKFLWMHDVNVGENDVGPWGNRFEKPDAIVALTRWHARHLQKLYQLSADRLAVIPNGINLERFHATHDQPRQPLRFVFSSSPDRGVDIALQLWPQIRKRWPSAELHVFYGWRAIDAIMERSGTAAAHLKHFKNNVEALLDYLGREKGGVFWHDRVGQEELAQELMISDIWLYPTYFLETFCITALEIQAAGIIPVTSRLGSLPEVVACQELLVEGYPNNVTYHQDYLDRLEEVIEADEVQKREWRDRGRALASVYTWDDAYQSWAGLIKSRERVLTPA